MSRFFGDGSDGAPPSRFGSIRKWRRDYLAAAVLIFAALLLPAFAETAEIYRDPAQPVEARVDDLLGRMTPDEKLAMLGGVDGFYLRGIERLGVPRMKMGDGPVGVRNWGKSTLYPATQMLAATWDVDLARRLGVSLGRDSRARAMHISLAPGVNIYRSPLCGRNYEYMGEDPLLAGRMATASIQGVQSQGVAATIKHFAANNSETRRSFISNDIDERTLREIYLPAYRMAVQEGGVWCFMDAYNLLNGEHCTANGWLNNKLLKEEWGFRGVVMSDWNATHDTAGAALGGLDLEMPAPVHFKPEALKPLIEEGKVPQAVIDEKVRRLLRLILANGWLDQPQEDKSIPLDDPQSAALALEVAREGITLLKNEGNLLPLDRGRIKTVALLGPNAFQVVTGLGSGKVQPFRTVSLKDALKNQGVQTVEVPWAEPLEYLASANYPGKLQREIFSGRKKTRPVTSQEVDRIDLQWDSKNPSLGITAKDQFVVRWAGEITPDAAGQYQFVVQAKDINVRVWLDDRLCWESVREATGSFVMNLEAGRPHQLRVEAEQRKKDRSASFQAGWGPARPLIPEELAAEVKNADAALIGVGFNVITGEGEGYDRTYELPGRQEELIKETAALNPRAAVILNAGGSVATAEWLDQVPAFLDAYYMGQEGGTALAEILFGDVNPSGRLPFSYEKRWEDCAAYGNYPKDATDFRVTNIAYKEGIFVGYRWFDRKGIAPLFPFGHGLSYTTFDFKNLRVQKDGVKVNVTNTGARAGAEVVQIYVGQLNCSVERPVRELKAFARVSLQPGETRTVDLPLGPEAFAFFHPEKKAWTVEPGEFVIEAGASSRDIRQSKTIKLDAGKGTGEL